MRKKLTATCINFSMIPVDWEFFAGKIFRRVYFRLALFSSLWPLDNINYTSWMYVSICMYVCLSVSMYAYGSVLYVCVYCMCVLHVRNALQNIHWHRSYCCFELKDRGELFEVLSCFFEHNFTANVFSMQI